jgi:hypothetical protein
MGTTVKDISISVVPPTQPTLPSVGGTPSQIRMPGGTVVPLPFSLPPATDCRIIFNQILPNVMVTLGPLGFIFCVLGVIQALIDCVNATIDSISQLNPGPLIDALVGLIEKAKCLAQMIPQVSLLYMLADVLDVVLGILGCIITALSNIQVIFMELAGSIAEADAAKDTYLKTQLESARSQSQQMADQTMMMMSPLTIFFAVLNILLTMIGMGPMPSLPAYTPGQDLTPIIEALGETRSLVQAIRDLLPA